MYRRFLNDNDYLGIISPDALNQMTRGNAERIIQAEESAEMSIVEYLSENYDVEKELWKGKYIAEYDRRITFPVGAHFYLDGQIYEVIRSISGYKSPAEFEYWEEDSDPNIAPETIAAYSQFKTYYTGDRVVFNGIVYLCLRENGFDFGEIRLPLVNGWQLIQHTQWTPTEYGEIWTVVEYNNEFYTLMSLEDFDNNKTPLESSNWGAIADYDSEHNEFDLSGHDYVIRYGKVWRPETDVNADIPTAGENIILRDPRNYNLKKHMVRLAIYELTKLIAPNNVSTIRIRDYEDSMKWLYDASKLRINPQIPRKLAEDKKEVMDWQLATFQAEYDPWKNPWLT